MIGWPELVVLAVLLLVFFGYRYLPRIGRSAGQGLRSGVDKAKGLSGSVGRRVEDTVDPSSIGRSAGRSLREVREVRDAFTGKDEKKANSSD
jgi:Sec-independent protein translocase protein TatA